MCLVSLQLRRVGGGGLKEWRWEWKGGKWCCSNPPLISPPYSIFYWQLPLFFSLPPFMHLPLKHILAPISLPPQSLLPFFLSFPLFCILYPLTLLERYLVLLPSRPWCFAVWHTVAVLGLCDGHWPLLVSYRTASVKTATVNQPKSITEAVIESTQIVMF